VTYCLSGATRVAVAWTNDSNGGGGSDGGGDAYLSGGVGCVVAWAKLHTSVLLLVYQEKFW